MSIKIPHLKVPFNIAGSSAAVVEQDSTQEIRQCILAALKTRVGSRVEAPDYGIPDRTFEQLKVNPSADAFLAAVEAGEPRVKLLAESEVEELVERFLIELEEIRV